MKSSTSASSERLRVAAVFGAGWVAAALLTALEFLSVATLCFGDFAGAWELSWGALWHLPAALGLAGLVGALGAGLALSFRGGPRVVWASALLVSALAAVLSYLVTSGRHFEPWWRRLGVVALVSLGTLFAARRLGPATLSALAKKPRVGVPTGVGVLIGMELLNRFALVRLYPGFHLGLAIACWGLAGVLGAVLVEDAARASRRGVVWLAAGLTVLGLGTLPLTAPRLARFDNVLWVLSEQAPLQRELLAVSLALAPRAPEAATQPTPETKTGAPGVDFRGRSVLLVTIDALRADHVGAYGYGRPTTPYLDELARRGVRFEHAYSATPHTSYSVASLMTGKYIRPLLLQGAGADSETLADHLRRYGYRTAAFYPPAIFFIDGERFRPFAERHFGFEYFKREFLEGPERVAQVTAYLDGQAEAEEVFVWVHLFSPHEPYQRHPEHDFGERDIDRYDGEIAHVDTTVRALATEFERRRPGALVIVTADHGEEFGDHGGRYHGTTVYEEQVRVPLLMMAEGALEPRVVEGPVQTIDLLPTLLSGLAIPLRPRIRGRDLGALLAGTASNEAGFAYAETEQQSMLARGDSRLLCERRLGVCRLFDIKKDREQRHDVGPAHPERLDELRAELRGFNASHGRYERAGLRAEGQGWPAALLRAMAGDHDAMPEVAELLDDADVVVRRKVAEVLFHAKRQDTAPALQLAVQRDEDLEVRNYAALALQRMGQGAAATFELLRSPEVRWRRLAALALAEQGDRRGLDVLLDWWSHPEARDHETSLAILEAFATLRAESAAGPLVRSLSDVRLRPAIASALARIGVEEVRGPLAVALGKEPYQGARTALAQALVELGATNELVVPLRRWLGVPDPLPSGLELARRAGILEQLGGPSKEGARRLRENGNLGELVTVVVPPGGNGAGVRVLVQAINRGASPARVLVGPPLGGVVLDVKGESISRRRLPEIHPTNRVELEFPPNGESTLRWVDAPEEMGLSPGRSSHLVVFAQSGVEVGALAVLAHQEELVAPRRGEALDDSRDENP